MYAVGASRTDFASTYRIAIASSYKSQENQISVLEKPRDDDSTQKCKLSVVCTTRPAGKGDEEFDHFPQTKILWSPKQTNRTDLFMTSSTCLNLYSVNDGTITHERGLPMSAKSPKNAPLTSFDWPASAPNKVGAAAVDTTCTIWDINAGKIETQLIAHDSQVNDISFSEACPHEFATVGMDGSMRTFDQRDLEHSTIVLETKNHPDTKRPVPLLRVHYRPDKCQMAALALDESTVYVVDIRMIDNRHRFPVNTTLTCGSACNSAIFTPARKDMMLTATSDGSVGLWDTVPLFPEKGQKAPPPDSDASRGKKPAWSYDAGMPGLLHASWPDEKENLLLLGHEDGVQVVNCDHVSQRGRPRTP